MERYLRRRRDFGLKPLHQTLTLGMAKSIDDQNPNKRKNEEDEGEEKEEELSFEDLGLDARLIRALSKKSITKPTPIQREAIPLILVRI